MSTLHASRGVIVNARALLWLGTDAPPLSAEQAQALGLDARHQRRTESP